MPLGGCKRPFRPADSSAVVLSEELVGFLNRGASGRSFGMSEAYVRADAGGAGSPQRR